jgi:hypothetical protein
VEYLDENPGVVYDMDGDNDRSYYSDYMPSTELADFLKRPLRIQAYTWTEGAKLAQTFQPWDNYFNSTAVKKKLDNYSFISCDLHIRILVNASPFYFGAGLASYLPLTSFNSENIWGGLRAGNTDMDAFNMPASQRPHIYIFPQTNQGGEMVLPFFYYKNWLNVGTRADFQNMGTVTLSSMRVLDNAGASAGSGVTVTVYAWAENVRLVGTTTGLALQCGSSDDVLHYPEYDYHHIYSRIRDLSPNETDQLTKFLDQLISDRRYYRYQSEFEERNGVISGPATTVAKIAGMLTKAPIIGPYAKATNMISSAVAGVASLFGFTNVPVVSDAEPYRPTSFYSFASPHVSQPTERLTLDPKNELTIDPRVAGLSGEDPLAISNLVTRESYVTQFTYTTANATDDNIFTAFVSPYFASSVTLASRNIVNNTPMGHISTMFGHWRGDIIFRFRFICSRFHRGRVLIQWDPTADVSLVGNSSNVVFTKVVDISEETDIEVRVPYLQATEYQECPTYTNSANYNSQFYASGTSAGASAFDARCFNGYLTVKVLTILTCPISTSTVGVLVSVKGAENLEFANPVNLPVSVTPYDLQSLVECDEGLYIESIPAPKDHSYDLIDYQFQSDLVSYEQPSCVSMGESGTRDPSSNLVYMGERVGSIRTLLRRTCHNLSTDIGSDTTNQFRIITNYHGYQPLYLGYDPNGIHSAKGTITPASNFAYNYVSPTYYNWMAWCFRGYRGSHTWHYAVNAPIALGNIKADRVNTAITAANYYTSTGLGAGPTRSATSNFLLNYLSGAAGCAVTNQHTQGGISVNYPMYSKYRFRTTDPASTTLGSSNDNTNLEAARISFNIAPVSNTTLCAALNISRYHSIGPDFNFLFFCNVPSLIFYTSPVPN